MIPDHILDDLKTDIGDSIEVEIFKEYKGKPSFIITPRLRIIGGSKGLTIRYYLVRDLNLKANETYQADIRRPNPKII